MAGDFRRKTIVAGAYLIVVALVTYAGLVFPGGGIVPWDGMTPPIWAPMAGLIFFPSFAAFALTTGLTGGPGGGAMFALATVWSIYPIFLGSLFWITGRGLFRGEVNVPRWIFWAPITVGSLNVLYFTVGKGWEYGIKFQGLFHTSTVTIENTLIFVAILMSWKAARRTPSFRGNLRTRWLFFFWLVWSAFPLLGELL